jgi:ribonucleotide reductase alpha subunit
MHFNRKREKSRKKKEETNHHQHTKRVHHVTTLPVTRREVIFEQTVASHTPLKEHGRHQCVDTWKTRTTSFSEFNVKNKFKITKKPPHNPGNNK